MSSFSFPDLSTYLDKFHSSLPPELQVYFTRQNIQLILRVIVIISTYLLFAPRLHGLFRKATGMPDPREQEIQERLEFLRQQREGGGAAAPKGVGVMGKDGGVYKVVAPKQAGSAGQTPASAKKGKAKGGRKKA